MKTSISKEKEIWKPLVYKNQETVYLVSNLGRVMHSKKLNLKKPRLRTDGYWYVQLHINGKIKKINIHRLVALMFIPNDNPEVKNQVNHIDGNKLNNQVSNLEWVTNSENIRHALKHGLLVRKKGFDSSNNKYSIEDIALVILYIMMGFKTSVIANKTRVDKSTILLVKHGKRYTDLSTAMGMIPRKFNEDNFDFEPFKKSFVKMIKEGLSNPEIIQKIRLDVTWERYNKHLRTLRKMLERSTTSRKT